MSWVKNNDWLKARTDNRIYWEYLYRFLIQFRRFRKRLVVAALLALIGSMTVLLILPIFGLLRQAIVSSSFRLLAMAVLAYLGVQLFQVFVNYLIRVYRVRISTELNQELVLKYYSKLLNVSIEDFIEFKRKSNLFQRVIDAMAVTNDFTNVVIYGIQSIIIVTVTLIVIGTISWLIFGVVSIGVALLFLFVFKHAPKVRVKHQRVLAVNYPLVSKMLEIIQSIFTIKALTASIKVTSDIKNLVDTKKQAEYEDVVEESRGNQGAQAISQFILALAVGVSFALMIGQRLQYHEAFALYVLVGVVLTPVVELAKLFQTLSSLSANIQNYFQVIDMQDETIETSLASVDHKSPTLSEMDTELVQTKAKAAEVSLARESVRVPLAVPASENVSIETPANMRVVSSLNDSRLTTDIAPERPMTRGGHIIFEDVEFAYRGGEVVLQGLSFKILPGEKISLIGRSGVGKTTVLRLLMGFLRPQRGTILVDGIDISKVYDKNEFRRRFGLVGQQDFFFGTSIRENLLFGLEARRSDEEIIEALNRVNLWNDIDKLQQRLDTTYLEEMFSGGQKQRFFIARALLRDPSIVLLDEPTSALDFENEDQVIRSIQELMGDRTTITIAHRLSTVRSADRVLVLHDRQIVASGSHKELYASNEYYKALCEFNSFII